MTDAIRSVPKYRLLRDGRVAMEVAGTPGVLVSTSTPPPLPGTAPVTHPFATATFYLASQEGELGPLLRGAADLASFLEAAELRGFVVEPVD
jgi:hypothetical protein